MWASVGFVIGFIGAGTIWFLSGLPFPIPTHVPLGVLLPQGTTMNRLTVLYGHPSDPAEFDRYYNEVHIPLAKKMKGLKGWTIGKCESATPGEEPPYYMIVGLYATTRADLEAVLASPEGQATIADVQNFATGGFTFMFDEEIVLIPCSLGGSATGSDMR